MNNCWTSFGFRSICCPLLLRNGIQKVRRHDGPWVFFGRSGWYCPMLLGSGMLHVVFIGLICVGNEERFAGSNLMAIVRRHASCGNRSTRWWAVVCSWTFDHRSVRVPPILRREGGRDTCVHLRCSVVCCHIGRSPGARMSFAQMQVHTFRDSLPVPSYNSFFSLCRIYHIISI